MKKRSANVSLTPTFPLLVLLFLSIFLLITGCSSSPGGKDTAGRDGSHKSSSGQTQVRIAYFPNITHAQALVMKHEQSLEQALGENWQVTWVPFSAGSSEVEALFAEAVDLGYIGPVPAINANVKSKGDVTVIANGANAGSVLIKAADSGIDSVSDLDGKTIAIPQIGNTQHLCLLNLLSENGLAPVTAGGSVEVAAVDNANLRTLFDKGAVDAALVPEPWGTILSSSDDIDILLDYDQIFLDGDYPVAVVVGRNDFMKEHPDAVTAFLKAHIEATKKLSEDPESCAQPIISEIEAVTGQRYEEDVVLEAFSRTMLSPSLSQKGLEEFSRISHQQGLINQLPGEELTDPSWLEGLEE